MDSKKLFRNNLIIILAILVTYVTIILYSDIEKVAQITSKMNIEKILFAFFLIEIGMFLFAIRFHRLVSTLGIKISIKKNILNYFFGLAFSATPFGAGTMIKSHIIKKETSAPISKTFPIILVEKWNELTVITILLVFFLSLHYTLGFALIVIAGIAIVASFFVIIKSTFAFTLLKRIIEKIPIIKKAAQNMEESNESLKLLTGIRITVEGIAITFVEKILEIVAVMIIFDVMGVGLSLSDGGQIYFSGVLLGFLSLIPGGLGVTEGSMLDSLVKMGNSFALASAAVIMIRLATFWLPVGMGLITFKYFMKEKFSF